MTYIYIGQYLISKKKIDNTLDKNIGKILLFKSTKYKNYLLIIIYLILFIFLLLSIHNLYIIYISYKNLADKSLTIFKCNKIISFMNSNSIFSAKINLIKIFIPNIFICI